MKRFVRRQTTADQELKLMARADELKADLLRSSTITASATEAVGGDAMTNGESVVPTPRPSLDQMWGLE
jgi:hypothetical protein